MAAPTTRRMSGPASSALLLFLAGACWHLVLDLAATPASAVRSQYDAPHGPPVEPMADAQARATYASKYAGPALPSTAEGAADDAADEGMHRIFLLPHTHDDVGWLYTVAGYFNNSVHSILDSVTADLAANPSHRFIWSEVKWIEMWWPMQNQTTRDTFKKLVASGQLEFVGAGYSQHDEVTPSYRDMVGNTVTGHEYLRQILGPLDEACPVAGRCIRFGWQIDMFAGYSAASPTLWTMAGYDGMVIRFEGPNDMRAQWDADQDYEFIWEPSAFLSQNRSRIATHTIRWNYGDMLLGGRNGSAYGYRGPDLTFDFDTKKVKTQADVERYATALVGWSKGRGSVYRNNRHLAVWGSDFQFTDAGTWFAQMDLIVAEINANPTKYNATIQYTTLAEYFDDMHELNSKGQLDLPVKRLLDFEYGWPHTWAPIGVPLVGLTQNYSWQYQTGAAASRPHHKQHVRNAAASLRTAEAAHALALATGALNASLAADFAVAWDALGVTQHHDSMPGTMQAAESVSCPDDMPIMDGLDSCNRTTDVNRLVLEDYELRLQEADNATAAVTTKSVEALQKLPAGSLSLAFDVNVSSAAPTVVVFNPTMTARQELVRVEFGQPAAAGSARADGATSVTVAVESTSGAVLATPKPFVVPSVYETSGGGAKTAVAAQVELNDRFVSQLTSSHKPTSSLSNAVYFVATVSALGTATYSVEFEDGGANSTTTVVPDVIVGAAAVAKQGLGYANDPECHRVSFDAGDGLMSGIQLRSDGRGCAGGSGSGTNVTTAQVRQNYAQYVDANGGAYCLIEQSSAVELPAPYRVSLTSGPVFQEVVQWFSFGYGLQQRVRMMAPPTATQAASIAMDAPRSVDVWHTAGRLPGNRELVSRLQTDLCTQTMLHTEASGLSELYPRPFNSTASIAQNYHAIVQSAVIRDETTPCNHGAAAPAGEPRQLTVLTRRTMAVASLAPGELEYMTMRRIVAASDNQGPWPLDDKMPMEDVMRIMVAPQSASEAARFPEALQLEQPLAVMYVRQSEARAAQAVPSQTGTEQSRRALRSGHAVAALPAVTGGAGFPPTVWAEVMVRESAPSNAEYMVRMQNVVAGGASVSVSSLADALGLPGMVSCVETTLSMQQTRAANDAMRLHWRAAIEPRAAAAGPRSAAVGAVAFPPAAPDASSCASPIVLDSLDIRTFTFAVDTGLQR